jgi:hypothetical protein
MKLRNGKILSKKVIEPHDYKKEYFQSDFLNIFYSIKNKFRYFDFHNQPNLDTKYTLCNLYAGFKIFFNKEYQDPYLFLYYLSNNTLLEYKDLPFNDTCYICGTNDSTPSIFCDNKHYVHIDCYFEQILVNVKPLYTSFVISNDPLRCDYCSSLLSINSISISDKSEISGLKSIENTK